MKTAAVLICVLGWVLSCSAAEPDLIQLVAQGDDLPPEFVDAVASLPRGEINQIRDASGRTALHIAAIRSHQAYALVLLLAGADVNARDDLGRTPLFDVMEARDKDWHGDADMMLLEMLTLRGADVNAQAKDCTTPLALAAERGDCRKAEFLIWRGAAVNPTGVPLAKFPMQIAAAKNDARMTSLLDAALRLSASTSAATPQANAANRARRLSEAMTSADLNAIEAQLDSGWNINEQNEKGETALLRAVQTNRADLADLLIFEGADPNIANKEGWTPLMASMRSPGIEGQRMSALLLLKGADIHAVSQKDDTALTVAAAEGYDFGVSWLIAAGADAKEPTAKGSVANYCTHGPTLRLLKHFGAPDKEQEMGARETDPLLRMIEAAKRGDAGGVGRELAHGVPVDAYPSKADLRTAMTWAVSYGRFGVIDLLLKHGANINRQYPTSGRHPLHDLAARGGDGTENDRRFAADGIRNLLARGANPDIQMKDGMTPLMTAAKEGVTSNAEALLKAGANINLRNKEGLTALGIARKYGRAEMITLLKTRGAVE